MNFLTKKWFWFGLAVVALAGGVSAGVTAYTNRPRTIPGVPDPPFDTDYETNDEDTTPTVQTVRPRQDRSFLVTIQQLATVHPYNQADLRTRASGVVRHVAKDIGDPVKRGELLIDIEVPDLQQDVQQKEAAIDQCRKELQLSRAMVGTAEAMVEVAQTSIGLQQAKVGETRATRDFRLTRLNRFKTMRDRESLSPGVVDEEERDYRASEAALEGAGFAVERARADLREKEASLAAARADVELKQSRVEVARKERDRARAMAEYALVTAPFDGVIVRRNVDLGTFVQNATTGASEPLMTVARTDIVTVVTELPDNAAPFLSRDTRAVVQTNELPGMQFEGRVTRFSPSIERKDRTVRVEVDLFNGSAEDYARFAGLCVASNLAPLGGTFPADATVLLTAGQAVWRPNLKSRDDPFPPLPKQSAANAGKRRLLPGMIGTMRVSLQKFADAYLLPASAVYTKAGQSYVLEVKDGKTVQLPVRVQVNDGRLAKVAVVERVPAGGIVQEVLHDLNGSEEIVASRQMEVGLGRTVHTNRQEW
jgi:multidrug resistance efflux pump